MSDGIVQGYRLSPQQTHLWLLQQHTPRVAFRSWCAVRIKGPLNVARLERAIQSVVESHEILRTTFPLLPGMTLPVQVVHQESGPWVQRSDLSGLTPEQQEQSILARAAADETSGYDSLPLFQCELLQLSADEAVMLLKAPAICADLRSLEMIVQQIGTCYGSKEDDTIESMQYADFAEWHHELITDDEGEHGRQYWNSHALQTDVKLPLENWNAEDADFRPAVLRVNLDGDVVGTDEGSLLALACWQVLIQRFNGSSNATIGKAFDGRRHPELVDSVGLYNRYVPIPVDFIDERLTMEQLLEKLAQAEKEAAQWQEYFAWPEPEGAGQPRYFAVCFEERRGASTFDVGDVTFSIYDGDATDDPFHLKLVSVNVAAPRLELHYDANRFSPESIGWLAEELTTLIADADRNPGAAISDLQSLSSEAHSRICKDFNQTTRDFPSTCIHKLFEAQVKKTPNVTAVVCGSEQATYAELNQRANQLARYLQRLGIGPDIPVGLHLERSVGFVVGMLAILKAGGAYLPLDVNAPRSRLATMLSEAGAPLLITNAGETDAIPGLRVLVMDDVAGELASEDKTDPSNETALENLAYVIFTSGSTGKPKGVGVEHRQLCNYVHAIEDKVGMSACRSFAIVSTLVADLAHTMLFPSLLSGGTLHLISEDQAASPEMLADYFSRHAIDCLKIVPTHLGALLTSSRAAEILPQRHLILGGEASSHSLLATIRELSDEVQVWNHYGPTETTVGCAAQQIDREDVRAKSITVGTPLANNTVYILDQRMRPVSIGVPGELYIGGAGVARGYVNRSELTAERFVPDPFSEIRGGRLYRTGDLARFSNDGRIEVLGRVDNQLKVRGYRIEPEEIQFALNTHPLVSQSVVIAREDRPGDKRLVAYVVRKQSAAATTTELREFLRGRLPDYMVPSTFVFLEALPLTPNGKIDRHALPAPEVVEKLHVAPRNSIEQELSSIWASALGVANPGIHDNFFELGGDSILAIQIVARANQAGMTLAPRQIFQHQTIAELAFVANDGLKLEAEQGIVTGEVPLTPVQARFFELALPDTHHYNQARLLTVRAPVDSQALQYAVGSLLRHHDALRLRFSRDGETWKQIDSEPDSALPFERIDVSRSNDTDLAEVLRSEAARLHTSLNLEHGPIIRVALFDGADKLPSYVLIVVHHLAVDTVSWGVLVEDLETAYRQVVGGGEISLPAKTTSFKRWAQELVAFAGSTTIAEEIDYWTSGLSQSVAKLPVDRSGSNTVASRRTVSASLTAVETRAVLKDLPTKHRTQINEVLLAAITRSLSRWMGSSALLVDLEGHGREHVGEGIDLARTVGWFTSIFPVLLDIGNSATPLAALRAVKEQLRAVPNRGIGYGVLRYLSADAAIVEQLARAPQAQVRFNYLGQRDGFLGSSKLFEAVRDASQDAQSPTGERGYLLNIISSVTNGELRFDWTYSENTHARETIESLAETCVAELRALLADTETAGTAYAPSDFPKAKISQNDLNTILAKLRT